VKFRGSYSVLDTWASGDWEKAIKMYFKLETFTSPAMEEGKRFHSLWAEQIKEFKESPIEIGAIKFKNPLVELKKVVSVNDWLDLVGVIDAYDRPIIYEWKTGKQSSESYASGPQLGVYGVLATLGGLYVEKAQVYHFDQYLKKSDFSIVWITDEMLKNSLNWIETLSSEMHNYLTENKLYDKYYYVGRTCPTCKSKLIYGHKKNGEQFIKCENNIWNIELNKAEGCPFVEWA
jgi:PD-(D/E)XK nuclease superfamily